MRYRVIDYTKSFNGLHPTTFFKTKKEAVAYQMVWGGEIQRKVGGEWYSY